jgi:hypothetical protein
VRISYYICVLFSGISLIIFLGLGYIDISSFLANGTLPISPDPLWLIIGIMGFGLFCFYFINKLKEQSHLITVIKKENQGAEKCSRFPLLAIIFLGIFFAWYISASYFTFGIVNSQNDGKCDYDSLPAEAWITNIHVIPSNNIASENEKEMHYHEFCLNHLIYYTFVYPVQILTIPYQNSTMPYQKNVKITYAKIDIKSWAELFIIIWVIFLLFVFVSSYNKCLTHSMNKKLLKALIIGILGGLSFIITSILLIILYKTESSQGFPDPQGNWILFLWIFVPSIIFTISIIQDAGR